MSLFSRSRKLVHFAINAFPTITLKNVETQLIPQRIFCAQTARNYADKFSITPKKKKSRKSAGNASKASLRQSQVFQLDPLRGEDTPVIPDTTRQHVISAAILQGITNILSGSELDSSLRDCQVEITQVKTTPDFRHATIYWTIPGEIKSDKENVQSMLDENTDSIRRLLPAYSSLTRFPQLVFTKDNSAENEAEMDYLIQQARNAESYTANANESTKS